MRKYLFIALALISLAACQKETVLPKVYGRYVPERKDDFAWENEYAAFRMYGPALRPENPSNGVDLWLKASPELVVDSFYYREHALGLPYHINYGKGLDCYKVGHTAGAGGLVVMDDEQLYVGGAYDRWEIVEQTPERFVFRLEYDSLRVGGRVLQEQITITAEAGKILNKAEVVLRADEECMLMIGGGICLHDSLGSFSTCGKCGLITYAEEAMSDKTAAQMNYEYNGATEMGRSYLAVFTPGRSIRKIVDGTLVSVQPYRTGDTFTYYFGAGWSLYNGPVLFPDDEAWENAVNTEILTL